MNYPHLKQRKNSWGLAFLPLSLVILSVMIASTLRVSSIVVPQYLDPLKAEEDSGDMEMINPDTVDAFVSMTDISKRIPCVVSFVKTYMNSQPSRIPVLVPEYSTNLEATRLYLSALQILKSTYVMNTLDPNNEQIFCITGVVLVENAAQLSNSSAQLIDLCGRDCRYLLVITVPFVDEESFLHEASFMIQLLWFNRIANVVLLGNVDETVYAARSLSFLKNTTSTPAEPNLVGMCRDNSEWTDDKGHLVEDMYVPLKMNETIVHVAFFEYEPYVSLRKRDQCPVALVPNLIDDTNAANSVDIHSSVDLANETLYASRPNASEEKPAQVVTTDLIGIEGQVINTLASALNFVIAVQEIPWKNITSIADEVNEALWGKGMEEVDMVVGGLPWAPRNETDYTLPYEVVQIVWLIPIHPHVSLQGLVAPLQKNVWFAVIGLLVFASIVELAVTRNVAFLEILALVIGVAWPKQPAMLSGRIRFASWVIFGYILTQFYLASLSGQLMASSSVQIETLKELASCSWLTIGGPASAKKLFEKSGQIDYDDDGDYDHLAEDNEINRYMLDKFHVFEHEEYRDNFDDLINERNFTLALAVTMNVSSMKPSFEGKHVHRMRETLASYPLSFAVWRGMPYLSALDKKISSLTEGGIIGYWARQISLLQGGYYDIDLKKDEQNLKLSALVPGFLLLVMGYALAAIFFLIEILLFRWFKWRKAKVGSNCRRNKSVERSDYESANGNKRELRRSEKKRKRLKSVKISVKEGKKLPEILGSNDWIARFNEWHREENTRRSRSIKRIEYPFEFVH